MRHFVWYDHTGQLGGVNRRSGGWPDLADLRDPQTSDTTALALQAHFAKNVAMFAGFAPYTCPCVPQVQFCNCAYGILNDHRFDGEQLTVKPELTVEINGIAALADGRPTDLPPGDKVVVVLKSDVPDGHLSIVRPNKSMAALIPGDLTLSFTSGESEPLELVVPPQGVSGMVVGHSGLVRRFGVCLRGWA